MFCYVHEARGGHPAGLSQCDAMVGIGGRDSANSLHLAELCAERCANTQFVENTGALSLEALRRATVGVTAGASAPVDNQGGTG